MSDNQLPLGWGTFTPEVMDAIESALPRRKRAASEKSMAKSEVPDGPIEDYYTSVDNTYDESCIPTFENFIFKRKP